MEASDHARRARLDARRAMEQDRQQRAQSPSPMSRSLDGLVRVGDWSGRHPLLEIIATAEQEWKRELDIRPSTVRNLFQTIFDSNLCS